MEEIIKSFKQLDTTCVSDALDRLNLPGGLFGIKALIPGRPICGPAFTVHYVPCGVRKGTVGDFLDEVAPGQVIVIDNGGREYCTVWGDIMTVAAEKKGLEGTLIDGVCRDVPEIRRLAYPLYSKGYYLVTGKDRVEVDGLNVPVAVSGVQVRPADIIMGDDSGALVVPAPEAEEVLAVALEIAETESRILEEVRKGCSLKDSRRKLGYHGLQTAAGPRR
jgi:regulator of RNase E activity RraA